jgi:A/G-specific adenine glycosylase
MMQLQKQCFDQGGIARFREAVYAYYSEHARIFPWRETSDPYRILVSEFMLQQTQTDRVLKKYDLFLREFPGIEVLAGADLQSVLRVWQGLGYNRRAMALRNLARKVADDHGGILPAEREALLALPGVGPSTAGAVLAFAHRKPVAFIETNIRRVFIHFFFPDRGAVKDREILPLVEASLDRERPREWYYALMDYGVMLGRQGPNPNTRSAHYKKQSPLEGSDRQIRGWIIKELAAEGPVATGDLVARMGKDPVRVYRILGGMVKEGLLVKNGDIVSIA